MADGFVHTVLANGVWINQIEGQGSFPSTWATRDEAVAVGRALAMGRETEHVIHDEDGTITERILYANLPALLTDSLGMTPSPTEVDPKEAVATEATRNQHSR